MNAKITGELALIVFAKQPRLGRVKTRIARDIGDKKALHIYTQLLAETKKMLKSVDADIYLYTDVLPHFENAEGYADIRLQRGRNLGQKMKQAFSDLLPHYSSVVIIGADCPYITSDTIHESFRRLQETDLVIGPSSDGGYYLMAMKNNHTYLFVHMEWSTLHVLSKTLQRASDKGCSIGLLPTLEDIDTWSAWKRYISVEHDEEEK